MRSRKGYALRLSRARGAVAVMFAVLAVFIFGIAAFAVDLTRALVVRNELQNAADAAALAGAGMLFPPVAGKPNWVAASDLAGAQISSNKSEGVALSSVTTNVGYWNIATRTSAWNTSVTPGPNDVPALRVIVNRDTGVNGGAMPMSFGRLLGYIEMPAGANAVAIITWPASAGPGALAPYAMSQCALDNYWDSIAGAPKGDANGPFEIVLGNKNSCKTVPNCNCGTWTSLDTNNNSASYIRGLMSKTNLAGELAVGDSIWIQPGAESSLFGDFDTWFKGKNISIPIVADACLDAAGSGGSQCAIVGYACFHTDYAVSSGNKKHCEEGSLDGISRTYINPLDINPPKCAVGYFSAGACAVPGGEGGGGPYYGSYIPPRLGQ